MIEPMSPYEMHFRRIAFTVRYCRKNNTSLNLFVK